MYEHFVRICKFIFRESSFSRKFFLSPIIFMDIVIDFDGTCVKHSYPEIGDDIGAAPVLKALVSEGHNLILFTMRSDSPRHDGLSQAIGWFEKHGIALYGVQKNPTQHEWTESPKAYGQLIIDDAALGCPLIYPLDGSRPYVNWDAVRRLLVMKQLLPPLF